MGLDVVPRIILIRCGDAASKSWFFIPVTTATLVPGGGACGVGAGFFAQAPNKTQEQATSSVGNLSIFVLPARNALAGSLRRTQRIKQSTRATAFFRTSTAARCS